MKYLSKKIFAVSLFLFVYCLQTQAQNIPKLISPGNKSEPGEQIKIFELVFTWTGVKAADGYSFYLSKKNREGVYELIFNSDEQNLIKENFYILPAEIVHLGGEYRWNIRAKIKGIWGQYSQLLYFSISSRMEEKTDKSESEKQFFEPGILLTTTTPQINWSKVPTADAYAVYISKKNEDDRYELILDSEKIGLIRDTFLSVPKGLLTAGQQYRWNMRAYNIAGWGEFSQRIYFSVKEQQTFQEPPIESKIPSEPSVMKTLSPIFHWSKVPGATGYGLVLKIKDKDGKYNEIFDSEKIGLIRDTLYHLPKDLLKDEFEYGWQLRSYNFAGWGNYSELNRFIVKLPKVSQIKEIKTKPETKRISETINSLTPTFSWFKVPSAIKYGLQIKKRDDKGNFNKIYDSEKLTEISDTFFTIPKNILEEGCDYSWNLRASNQIGWGDYGEDFYFTILLDDVPSTPIVFSPGGLESEVEVINSLTPRFTWNSSDKSDSYLIYISKKEADGNYKLIFNSEENDLIRDTFFTVASNVLQNNGEYRWNLRAKNLKGFSNYSIRKYFQINLIRQPASPKLVSPGYKSEVGEIVNSLTPTFIWNRVNGADSYSLFISQTSNFKNYELIYDSEKNSVIKDTIFTPPNNILKNGGSYRWNIKAVSKEGWKVYSDTLYFKVGIIEKPKEIKKEEVISSSEIDEVFLLFQYAGVVNANITALYKDDEIFLPLSEVLDNLQINHEINMENSNVAGFYAKDKSEWVFDFTKKMFSSEWKSFHFSDKEFITGEMDFFISPRLLEQAFNFKTKLDYANLTLAVSADKTLPVYDRFLIEQKYFSFKNIPKQSPPPLIYKRNRSFLNGFVLDYSLTSTLFNNYKPYYSYSAGLGGEILGGDANILLRGFITENQNEINEELRWRYVLTENKYLTQISVGDLFAEGVNSYSFRGIKITNEPFEPRRNIGPYLYRDKTEPNWIIELYINDQIIGITKSDAQGYYSFELPLGYGMSLTELKYYGPTGEFRSERKVFQIPFYFLPASELNYFISGGYLEQTEEKFSQAAVAIGITNWLTNKTGFDIVDNRFYNKPIFFNSLSARISSNYLINLFTAPKIVNKVSANAIYFSQASIGLSYAKFKQNPLYNPSNIDEEIQGSFYLPVSIKSNIANLQFTYDNLKLSQAKRDDYRFNVTFNFEEISPFIGINYAKTLNPNSINEEAIISTGSLLNVSGLFKHISFLKGNLMNVRINYNLIKKRLDNFYVYFASTLLNYLRVQVSYERNFIQSLSNVQLQLFMDLPFTRYLFSTNTTSHSQNLQGAIGYNFEANRVYFSNQPQRGRSTVMFQTFADDNGNNVLDPGEKIIQGADISIDAATRIEKNSDGTIIAYELNPYTIYTAKMNETKIKNPLYKVQYSEFSFMTDPNGMKIIQIPFFISGDVSGKVVRYIYDEKTLVYGLKLIIINVNDQSKSTTSTFGDGSFYYFGLKPGNYTISIDPQQLQNMKLVSVPSEFNFSISADRNGDSVEDLEFVLQ